MTTEMTTEMTKHEMSDDLSVRKTVTVNATQETAFHVTDMSKLLNVTAVYFVTRYLQMFAPCAERTADR
jgi:hypothetical protein